MQHLLKQGQFIKTISCFSLHLGIQSGPCEEQLVRLDEQCNEKTYKVTISLISLISLISKLKLEKSNELVFQVGVMYCRAGQQTEEDMYNNEEGGPAFNEFLDLLGQRVRLKGFQKYKAGLCNKSEFTKYCQVFDKGQGARGLSIQSYETIAFEICKITTALINNLSNHL